MAAEPYARPVDGDHALLVGALVGMVMKANQEGFVYEANIIDDDEGNHLATFSITAPSGWYLVHVEKVEIEDQLRSIQARLQMRRKG
jgi:hypothetical protein